MPQDGERGGPGGRVTYVFVQPERQPKPSSSSAQPNYGSTNNGSTSANAAGSSSHDEGRAPPTYAEAVKGDNKVQTQD